MGEKILRYQPSAISCIFARMTAGYSRRSLVDKLGIKPPTRIALLQAPRGYRTTLGALPDGVKVATSARGSFPFIQYFVTRRSELERRFATLKRGLEMDGSLWISWPKGQSGVRTDINENVVRDIALANGLVDVKVCAVDDVWSGLKLVRRLKDRTSR